MTHNKEGKLSSQVRMQQDSFQTHVQSSKSRLDRQELMPSAHVKTRKNSFFLNPIKHQVEQSAEESTRK